MKKLISFVMIISLLTAIGFGSVTINAAEKGPLHIIITSGELLEM